MPHINLLPWREELRKRRQQEFGVIAGGAVGAMALIVLLVHLQYNAWIAYQEERNEFLNQQIAALDKKIKEIKGLEEEKQRLLARMEIIQKLQSSRPEIVHVFDELVRTLPEGVYYSAVSQKGDRLDLRGVAQSNARVSSLMRNIDKSSWLAQPNLKSIVAQGTGKAGTAKRNNFELSAKQTAPKKSGEEQSEEDSP